MLSSASGSSQPPQPLHADRAYFSTSNRIEIRFTGSMEALAAAEEGGGAAIHRGQSYGRMTGHASPGGGTDDGAAAMQKATQKSVGHRTNVANNERSSALPLAILHYKGKQIQRHAKQLASERLCSIRAVSGAISDFEFVSMSL